MSKKKPQTSKPQQVATAVVLVQNTKDTYAPGSPIYEGDFTWHVLRHWASLGRVTLVEEDK